MFEQKIVKPPEDHIGEFNQILSDIKRRLNNAEEDNVKFLKNEESTDQEYQNQVSDIENQISVIKLEINSMRKELRNTISSLQEFVKLLKLKAKKNEFEPLLDKAETWNPERLITKNSFSRLIDKN